MNFLNKVTEHALSGVEVCNHAIFKWTDSDDVAWSTTNHLLGFKSNSENSTSVLVDCNYRWLIQNDATTSYIDERICST